MGFYNEKLEKYSTKVSFTPENVEKIGAKIVFEKERQIKELDNELSHVSKLGPTEGEDSFLIVADKLTNAQKELDFIKTLSPVELVQFMVYVENYDLTKLSEKLFEKQQECLKNLDKYSNKKGFLGKASAVFGQNERLVEKHKQMLNETNKKLNQAQLTHKEWKELAPENQALYILGRAECDSLVRFDTKGYASYMEAQQPQVLPEK